MNHRVAVDILILHQEMRGMKSSVMLFYSQIMRKQILTQAIPSRGFPLLSEVQRKSNHPLTWIRRTLPIEKSFLLVEVRVEDEELEN